jgi:hypothetical protein
MKLLKEIKTHFSRLYGNSVFIGAIVAKIFLTFKQ